MREEEERRSDWVPVETAVELNSTSGVKKSSNGGSSRRASGGGGKGSEIMWTQLEHHGVFVSSGV